MKALTTGDALKISGFDPVQDDDFLVAYFIHKTQDGKPRVECIGCRRTRPNETDAQGIFKSDLPYIPKMEGRQVSCVLCEKPLNELAAIYEEEFEILELALANDTDTDPNDVPPIPCMVCGAAVEDCVCTAGEVEAWRAVRTDGPHVASVLDLATFAKDGVLGISNERLCSIVQYIMEKGDDASSLTLTAAAEKYPDQFLEFA